MSSRRSVDPTLFDVLDQDTGQFGAPLAASLRSPTVLTEKSPSPAHDESQKREAPPRDRARENDSSGGANVAPAYFSVRQLAAHFSVSVPTIWRWTKSSLGFPQPIKLSPGTTRWAVADIRAYELMRGLRG